MSEIFACPINTENKKRTSKILWVFLLLFFLLPLLINTLLIIPVYTVLSTDSVYSGSTWLAVIKYLQDFFDLSAFSSAYALIIFSSLLLDKKRTRFIVIFYALAYLLQAPLKILMNAAIYGSVGTSYQLIVDTVYLAVYFILSMIQLLVVYIFAATDANKYLASLAALKSSKNQKKERKRQKVCKRSSLFKIYRLVQSSSALGYQNEHLHHSHKDMYPYSKRHLLRRPRVPW